MKHNLNSTKDANWGLDSNPIHQKMLKLRLCATENIRLYPYPYLPNVLQAIILSTSCFSSVIGHRHAVKILKLFSDMCAKNFL